VEDDTTAQRVVAPTAIMVPAPPEPVESLVVRAKPIAGAVPDPEAESVPPLPGLDEAAEAVPGAIAEREPPDRQWADQEVAGYALELAVRGQWLPTRLVKVLIYWPLEEEHAEESGKLAWIIFLAWLCLGIVASFENLALGLGLAIAGLYGGALVRYFVVR
jgi:hypothetical protein